MEVKIQMLTEVFRTYNLSTDANGFDFGKASHGSVSWNRLSVDLVCPTGVVLKI